MDEPQTELRPVPPSLTAALRRARLEDAERSEVVAELRGAETARLEMLQDALRPVLDQVPEGIDLFDCGLLPGDHPRLFVDMIAFVEMGRDKRAYRFLQDTRHGRVTLAETEKLDTIVGAVTQYIARRLVEREKSLASDRTIEIAARAYAQEPAEGRPAAMAELPPAPAPRKRNAFLRIARALVEILGSLVLIALVLGGAYFAAVAAMAWWAMNKLG
ncbi:MAG: hypothetical protein JWL62_2422 [Hyphomicrobiales bacterium]|nr:hypothetical protein [Hyphomicrobiales bacterium]